MKLRKVLPVTAFVLTGLNYSPVYSQEIISPNYGLKSHETLEVTKVEVSPGKTLVSLVIENRIEGGTFCADKNIYIIESDGSRIRLKKTTGIPVCPRNYKFRQIGEKLEFTLEFPPLKTGTKWIDIIEDCTSNCFWFYGLTLDNDLNKQLNAAFLQASKGKPADNILLFKSLLERVDGGNSGMEGLLYINIITAANDAVNKTDAIEWYKKLASSGVPRAGDYIKYLNDKGIKYQ